MFEAYKIGVTLSLNNRISSALSVITKDFRKTHAEALLLHNQLNKMKALSLSGILMGAGGALVLSPFVVAITKAAELQKHMIAIQIATRGSNAEIIAMRHNIENVASQTIYSNIDVAKMGKLIATGTGLGASQVSSLIPVYAKFADVQQLMKGTPFEESTKSGIRLAHTAQHYDSESLGKYLDLLTKASLIIPGSLSEVGTALKYSQGIAKTALGINDNNVILLISLLNRLGFSTSRGGTNLVAALTRTIPGVFGSGLLKGRSNEALRAMNMTDEKGHSRFFVNGKFDAFAWMRGLSEYVAKTFASKPEAIARQDIMKNFQRAFGTQGSRVAALFSDPQALTQLKLIGQSFQSYGGVESMQEKFADESVTQKFINAKTNFVSALTEIGWTLLPMATKWLTSLNIGLKNLITWITNNPKKVEFLSKAFVSLGVAMMLGGTINLLRASFIGLNLISGLCFPIITKMVVALGTISAPMMAVAAAGGYLGYIFGTLVINPLINKLVQLATGGREDTLGGALFDLKRKLTGEENIELYGDAKLARLYAKNHPQIAPHSHPIIMDGRKVTSTITNRQANEAERAQYGTGRFDSIMTPMPVGY